MIPPGVLTWRLALSFCAVVAAVTAAAAVAVSRLDGGGPLAVALGLAAAVGALGLTLACYLSRKASSSERATADGVRRVLGGDLDYRFRPSGGGENADLRGALNAIAATLQRNVAEASVERGRLSTVLDTMADGVIVVDTNRRVLLINSAAEQLLRTGPRTRSGSLAEVIRDHEVQQVVSRAAETRRPHRVEVQISPGDRFVRALATPLVGADDGGVLLTLRDMTELRQLETTRKEFVTNVSHELRNPLAAAKAMVETLEDGAVHDASVAEDFLGRVHGEIDRMTNLVKELLELARLESGQAALHLAPFDLAGLLSEAADYFRPRAERAGIGLTLEVEDGLPNVLGESQKIRQVMENLLDNALKFTPSDGRITVTAAAADRFVSVSVVDTGPGIDPEHLPHVFERFYKADRSRHDQGTGLGLAITKHIVQAHGGRVDAESRLGEGTAFTVRIPRAD